MIELKCLFELVLMLVPNDMLRDDRYYLACIGRKIRGKFERSVNQNGHLIL